MADPGLSEPRIYLDISRLRSAGGRATPSGIERVELAYAKHFGGAGTRFVAAGPGGLHFLPSLLASAYVASLDNAWTTSLGQAGRIRLLALRVLLNLVLLTKALAGLLPRQPPAGMENSVYLNLSHRNLTRRAALLRFRSRTGAKLLFFVHDLIPITHPEYARPGERRAHCRRMDTVAALADTVLVNSAATEDALRRYLGTRKKSPEIHVTHLGIASTVFGQTGPQSGLRRDADAARPYFLVLATIEPRKNHLLLLHLWRRLAAEFPAPPRLILAGRRGWENEMVVDMLERCGAIAPLVEERRDVCDAELGLLLRGACALLLPSFAEGFGLPVAEALGAGTPVICSDLPALREIGLDVPEYLDPLDGPAWRRMILDYAAPSSHCRAAQCERLRAWSALRWDSHFAQVSAILHELAARRGD